MMKNKENTRMEEICFVTPLKYHVEEHFKHANEFLKVTAE